MWDERQERGKTLIKDLALRGFKVIYYAVFVEYWEQFLVFLGKWKNCTCQSLSMGCIIHTRASWIWLTHCRHVSCIIPQFSFSYLYLAHVSFANPPVNTYPNTTTLFSISLSPYLSSLISLNIWLCSWKKTQWQTFSQASGNKMGLRKYILEENFN